MDISFLNIKNLPVVLIDNLYNADQQIDIWQELEFISGKDKMKDPEDTGTATDANGNILKKNKAMPLDTIYADRSVSNILTENRILWDEKFMDNLMDHHLFFRYLRFSNMDSTLVSYYEDSDYYAPHRDDAILTAITWFYKEPKKFQGGDFTIEDEVKIECKHNRCVLFPSMLQHSVDPIKLDTNLKNKKYGRYAISQFITINS